METFKKVLALSEPDCEILKAILLKPLFSLKLELKEGDKILVTYGGAIRNTYPAQIDVVKIQKSDESL